LGDLVDLSSLVDLVRIVLLII